MDRLEAMSVLLEAVETGSLSAAGRRLGMPLATVSRKITDLEAHLRTRLLLRGGRKLVLTDAGRSYVQACRRIVEDVHEAERAASGEYRAPRGELVVSAPIVLGRTHVLPILAEFLQAYPEIQVRLFQNDRMVNMLEEHVDVAVRVGELPDSSLIATRVGLVRRVVVASPAFLKAHGTPQVPEDLSGQDCIAFDLVSHGNRWDFGKGAASHSVPIRVRLTVNTADAAMEAALTGIGLVRLAAYPLAASLKAGRLVSVLEDDEPPPAPISLVYPSQRQVPLKLRAFLDFAAPRLRERLG
jgi:DNA-binding transcriptional LysR family regulator